MNENHTTIVAEPGCTHEGHLERLLALVDMTADSGADAFKSQWCSDPEKLTKRRNAPEYLPFYQWLKFPASWHGQLADRCNRRGIEYASTVYLPEDVAKVDPYIDFYKIAAFESGAADMFNAISAAMMKNEKPLVISLGLGTSIIDVATIIKTDGIAERTRMLRCVSAYPTPLAELHLNTMGSVDGLSDHTAAGDPDSLLVGALAVAAGASWIERHICLESCMPTNPDYAVSLSQHPFAEYVRRVRVAETALGSANARGVMPSEQCMLRYAVRVDGIGEDNDD